MAKSKNEATKIYKTEGRARKVAEKQGLDVRACEGGFKLVKKSAGFGGSSKVKPQYKAAYGKEENCGDAMAKAFKAVCDEYEDKADGVVVIAKANGIDLSRWEGKNPGMVRMNLGNVLRGMVKRGEKVKIGSKTYKQAA